MRTTRDWRFYFMGVGDTAIVAIVGWLVWRFVSWMS